MAQPSEILSDPDFINANAATKQAIFAAHVAQDPDFVNANPATQQAIKSKFGFTVTPPAPATPLNKNVAENITGSIVEPLMKMGSGMIAKPLGDVVGLARMGINLATGSHDVSPTDLQQQVQSALTYEPRTVAGASKYNPINAFNTAVGSTLGAIGDWSANKLADPTQPAYAPQNMAANALREAVPQAIGIAGVKYAPALTKKIINMREAKIASPEYQATLSNEAGRLATAEAGVKLGLVADPAAMNRTVGNVTQSVLTGSDALSARASKLNTAKLPQIAKTDMGIDPTVSLAGAEGKAAFESALAKHNAPYEAVSNLPQLVPSSDILRGIEALKQVPILGGDANAAAANAVVDKALKQLKPQINSVTNEVTYPHTPAQILKDIQQNRQLAKVVYNSAAPTAAEMAEANARWGLAKQLEAMIDENLAATNPTLLQQLREARTAKAQIHAWQDATDLTEGKIDPAVLAKQLRDGEMLTGAVGDVANFANAFPRAMGVAPTELAARAMGHGTRAGLGAAVGATLGHTLGLPGGAYTGALLGGLSGEAAGYANAMRLLSPTVQNANALAMSARLASRVPPTQQDNLRPAEMNYGPNQPVPYDWSQQVITPDQVPNWVPGRNDIPPRVTPTGLAPGPAQIGMSQGPVGGQMGVLRAEDARLYQQQAAAEAAAQAAAEQRAAATRQPAGGGVQLDVDPITGKLIPTDQSIPGAKLAGVGESSLDSAVRKLTGTFVEGTDTKYAQWMNKKTGNPIVRQQGQEKFTERTGAQAFDMTAEERIAWNKAKADLAEVMPGMKALDDKAIASKMMDRQWIADTIQKLREQDAAFNMMAERSALNRAASDAAGQAALKREKLRDQLIALEDRLRPPRPVSSGSQGPKTRAAKNKLILDNVNALAP